MSPSDTRLALVCGLLAASGCHPGANPPAPPRSKAPTEAAHRLEVRRAPTTPPPPVARGVQIELGPIDASSAAGLEQADLAARMRSMALSSFARVRPTWVVVERPASSARGKTFQVALTLARVERERSAFHCGVSMIVATVPDRKAVAFPRGGADLAVTAGLAAAARACVSQVVDALVTGPVIQAIEERIR